MRRSAILCVGAAALVAICLPYSEPLAFGDSATLNGDTNGDGQRDLSDAVYLLQWLFSGGREPAEILCEPAPTPRSVYPQCADVSWRFVDNGDGTISDHCTRLMWQKEAVDSVIEKEAGSVAAGLRLGGHDDWRVPTANELLTLADFSRRIDEDHIHPIFPDRVASFYISSQPVVEHDPPFLFVDRRYAVTFFVITANVNLLDVADLRAVRDLD